MVRIVSANLAVSVAVRQRTGAGPMTARTSLSLLYEARNELPLYQSISKIILVSLVINSVLPLINLFIVAKLVVNKAKP